MTPCGVEINSTVFVTTEYIGRKLIWWGWLFLWLRGEPGLGHYSGMVILQRIAEHYISGLSLKRRGPHTHLLRGESPQIIQFNLCCSSDISCSIHQYFACFSSWSSLQKHDFSHVCDLNQQFCSGFKVILKLSWWYSRFGREGQTNQFG